MKTPSRSLLSPLSPLLIVCAMLVAPAAAAESSRTPVTIKEFFLTSWAPQENIDSMATWHGPNGEHWLLATSKQGHSVNVYDAVNGAMIRRLGGRGTELGQFDRPNGIATSGNYAFVVERDNRRVQILSLPDLVALSAFGAEELRKPYGLWIHRLDDETSHVYVTDNYETPAGDTPPLAELGERIRVYEVETIGRITDGELVEEGPASAFGATSGPGVLHVVESILGDPAHNRLLIADEDEDASRGMNIKIYDLAGTFTGRTIGDGLFQFQAEGIALYDLGAGAGYYVCADQGKLDNFFHVFDRETLAHVGTFRGERTLQTDGIWITQTPMPRFPSGALYASTADAAVTAFSWAEIAAALGLRTQ